MPDNRNDLVKKVLFIAYLFPPVGGGGVQRSSKFVKYLPQFGWMPLVLTVKEPYDFYSDKSLLDDIEGDFKIYRTSSIEPMKWVRKFLKKRWQNKINESREAKTSNKTLKPRFLVKLKIYLLIPDNEILWLPFAVWKGWRIIRKENPSIIYSTASPYTDHLIAFILVKLFKLPWAADFRDFWVDRPNFPQTKWRLFIDRKLEKLVLKKANHIISATSLISSRFKELFPDNKYTTITNGYDENDFSNMDRIMPSPDEFTITYTGTFNKERNPQKFFLALKRLIEQRQDFKEKIKLKIIGQLDNPGDFDNINSFKKIGLEKYSDLITYLPHHQAISEMLRASVLLLFIGETVHGETILTGKIFEYLRSGRPILAVVPPNGLAAKVIKDTNSGIVVSRDSEDEIADGISKLFDLYLKNKLNQSFKRQNIEIYNRKNLTGKLSQIFTEALSGNI